MVHSFSLPLKPSDEAVVRFLMEMVYGSQRKRMSRYDCLHHDVIGANKLLIWIFNNEKKSPRVFTSICNLVYGNTLVLSSQVTRLLSDAIRAKQVLSFTSFNALEEERKRKTREQIEKALQDDEYATPKKKQRSNNIDDYMVATPVLISQALRQNITMTDVASIQKDTSPFLEDDLEPVTEQQLEMLYGLLDPSDRPSSFVRKRNTEKERTFIERFSSDEDRRKSLFVDVDFEMHRQSHDQVFEQYQTPRKSSPVEESFEPAPHLAEILMYGRLPILSDEERRKSLEDEMEEARSHAINNNMQTSRNQNLVFQNDDDSQHSMGFGRIPSDIHLDDDIFIPKQTPKMPRSIVKSRKGSNTDELDGINNRVPLKDMHRRMENFSSLHFSSTAPLLHRLQQGMTLRELMNPVPYQFRKHANEDLLDPFRVLPKKHQDERGTGISDEESEPSSKRSRPSDFDLVQLDPINLSQLKIMATPLKEKSPPRTPQTDGEKRDEFEYPRNFDQVVTPIPEFQRMEAPVLFDDFEVLSRHPDRWPIEWSGSDEITPAGRIREKLLGKCNQSSPFEIEFDEILDINASRREAARTFYVLLELLKEREIAVRQQEPFSSIQVKISNVNSDDLEDSVDK